MPFQRFLSSSVNVVVVGALIGAIGYGLFVNVFITRAAPFSVSNCAELQNIKNYLAGDYELINDINCDVAPFNTGQGFEPIGTENNPFTGSLNGRNHTISGLYINRPGQDYVGLFGAVMSKNSTAAVSWLHFENVDITGKEFVGTIGGYVADATPDEYYLNGGGAYTYNSAALNQIDTNSVVHDVHVRSGTVTGVSTANSIGGLIGNLQLANVVSSSVNVDVSGANYVGGLVGQSKGLVWISSAAGSVNATGTDVGGLVGFGDRLSSVQDSFSTNTVLGVMNVGGIIGRLGGEQMPSPQSSLYPASLQRSYSTGDVDGETWVAGLVGANSYGGTIQSSFATGFVGQGRTLVPDSNLPNYSPYARLSIRFGSTDFPGGSISTDLRGFYRPGNPTNCNSISGEAGKCYVNQPGDSDWESLDITYFYSTSNLPMSGHVGSSPIQDWDFENIWLQNANTFPTLQENTYVQQTLLPNRPPYENPVLPGCDNDSRIIACWLMEEGTGTSTEDNSGNGHDITWSNWDYWDTKNAAPLHGSSLLFPSSTQRFVSVNGLPIDDQDGGRTTVSFWTKWGGTENASNLSQRVLQFSSNNGNQSIYFDNGCFGLVDLNRGHRLGISDTDFLDGDWHHVAMVLTNDVPNPENFILYIDGEAQSLGNCGATDFTTPITYGPNLQIGSSYNGNIDDLRLYDGALSDCEIAALNDGGDESLFADCPPSVVNISSTNANGSYGNNDVIKITMEFTNPVSVVGYPSLLLDSGGNAVYESGSDTDTLTFRYVVARGESSIDLTTASEYALELHEGESMTDSRTGNPIQLRLPSPRAVHSLAFNKDIVIETACADPDIIGCWKLDDKNSATAVDSSSYRNSAILTGNRFGVWANQTAPTRYRNAGSFIASEQSVLTASNVPMSTTMGDTTTATFWVKWDGVPEATNYTRQNVLHFSGNNSNSTSLSFHDGCFGLYDVNQLYSLGFDDAPFDDGKWHHVSVLLFNGIPTAQNVHMYVDGAPQSLSSCTDKTYQKPIYYGDTIRMGTYAGNPLFGGIDDIRLYNQVLSDCEIQALANGGDGSAFHDDPAVAECFAGGSAEYENSCDESSSFVSNGSFESPITLVGGIPTAAQRWTGDLGGRVQETLGITPKEGDYMWQFLMTAGGHADPKWARSDFWHLIDLEQSGLSSDQPFFFSAFVNRIAGDSETDANFSVSIATFNFPISDLPGRHHQYTRRSVSRVTSDADIQTWENLFASIDIPSDTTFILVNIGPNENVYNDAVSPEFDGHFLDAVCTYTACLDCAAKVLSLTSDADNGQYTTDDTLDIQVTFSGDVFVDTSNGIPTLALDSGGIAEYTGGSGTPTLTFRYTVELDENSIDLTEASYDALSLNGAVLKDVNDASVQLRLPAPTATHSLFANKNIEINTSCVHEDLIGCWKLDDKESTVAKDSSQNAKDATLTGDKYTSWKTDTATVSFTNHGSLALKTALLSASNISINQTAGQTSTAAFWIKWNGIPDSFRHTQNVLTLRDADDGSSMSLSFHSGCFGFYEVNQGYSLGLDDALLDDGEWHHVTALLFNGVVSAANSKIFIDGIDQQLSTCFIDFPKAVTYGPTLRVGGTSFTALDGSLDDVRLYNGALSDCEIQSLISGKSDATFDECNAVNITSPDVAGTYTTGDEIRIDMEFPEAVSVTGIPLLELDSGGTAVYQSGNGTSVLRFLYTVEQGDNSPDLDQASFAALDLATNSATIEKNTGGSLAYRLPAPRGKGSLFENEDIVVNTSCVDSDLIGCWKMDEQESTEVSDSSQYQNHGTLSGNRFTSWTDDVPVTNFVNHHALTNEVNVYAVDVKDIPINQDLGETTTAAFWIKWDGIPDSYYLTQNVFAFSDPNNGYHVNAAFYQGCFALYEPNQGYSLGFDDALLDDGEWHHISALLYNGQLSSENTKIFVDGEEQLLHTCWIFDFERPVIFSPNLHIGTLERQQLLGSLDDLRLYKRALSDCEINELASGNDESGFVDCAPKVVSVTTPNSNIGPRLDASYGQSDDIDIDVTFSAPIAVTGTPQLELDSGGIAEYTGGSNSDTLTFSYQVLNSQNSIDLTYSSFESLLVEGASITSVETDEPAQLRMPAPYGRDSLYDNAQLVVDTSCTEEGIVGCWKFDAREGTLVLDQSNNENNATFSASNIYRPWSREVAPVDYITQHALFADRNVSNVIANSVPINTSFGEVNTYSFWVKYKENTRQECADGKDNDGDGLVDYPQDTDCDGYAGTSEYNATACTNNNLLRNPSFEQSITLGAYPTDTGYWGGVDRGQAAGASLGIIPRTGSKMWQALETGGKKDISTQTDLWQFIDAADIPAGSVLSLEGFFNRVLGNTETDTAFKVSASTYDFPLSEFPARNLEYTDRVLARVQTDGDTRTWERAYNTITVPAGTTFIGVNVSAIENVINDPVSPEFDGHFMDDVCVYIQSQPQVFECNDGVDNDGDRFVDYPDDLECFSAEDVESHSDVSLISFRQNSHAIGFLNGCFGLIEGGSILGFPAIEQNMYEDWNHVVVQVANTIPTSESVHIFVNGNEQTLDSCNSTLPQTEVSPSQQLEFVDDTTGDVASWLLDDVVVYAGQYNICDMQWATTHYEDVCSPSSSSSSSLSSSAPSVPEPSFSSSSSASSVEPLPDLVVKDFEIEITDDAFGPTYTVRAKVKNIGGGEVPPTKSSVWMDIGRDGIYEIENSKRQTPTLRKNLPEHVVEVQNMRWERQKSRNPLSRIFQRLVAFLTSQVVTPPDEYFAEFCADADNEVVESDESNNCLQQSLSLAASSSSSSSVTVSGNAGFCGDGVTQVSRGEECDDGNLSNEDACLRTCVLNVCGDGNRNPATEQCDDGNLQNEDGCNNKCQFEFLSGTQGNNGNTGQPSAPPPVEEPSCGNSIVEPSKGEQCDNGALNGLGPCSITCKLSTCGDGVVAVWAGEECDDGNTVNTDACTNTCKKAACGDGYIQIGEDCDDGNYLNNDACPNDCTLPVCGDGFREGAEQCDDGNLVSTDSCSDTCRLPSCGDGALQAPEACDDGNADNTDSCTIFCQAPSCGDGFVQANEQCDDGNSYNFDTCPADCKTPICGDGIRDGLEQCDDGNLTNLDGCTNSCKFAVCGDRYVQPGEECDDGNNSNTDGCTNSCTFALCGDGILQDTEQCDDGNTSNNDGCSNSCILAFCGDAFVQPGEQCDDGNRVHLDSCPNDCRYAVCGDSILEGFEECDDGNVLDGDGCSETCLVEAVFAVVEDAPRSAAPEVQEVPQAESECTRNDECRTNLCIDGSCRFCASSSQCERGQVCLNGICTAPQQTVPASVTPVPIPNKTPLGDTGPAAVVVIAAGAALGFGWSRRRKSLTQS